MSERSTQLIRWILVLASVQMLCCGGPEAKKMKFFNKGKARYEQGEYVKAGLEFKNALQIDPKFAEGYYMLGLTELRQREFKKAFARFAKATELDPGLLEAQIELARLLLAGKAADKAMERVDVVLEQDPENQDGLLLKASALLAGEETAAARALVDSLLARDVKVPEAYLLLALSYVREGNAAKAESALKQGLEANPESVKLQLALFDFYAKGKRPEEAAAALKRLIELEPEKTERKIVLAGLYWDAGKTDEAKALLREVLEADPQDEKTWSLAAGFYTAKEKPEDAAGLLKEGIGKNPKSFDLRFELSRLCLTRKKPAEALAPLEEYLALPPDPGAPETLKAKNAVAEIQLSLREVETAERYVDEVLEEDPANTEAHYTKGRIYLLRGDGENAVSALRTTVDAKPEFIPGYLRLAEAHMLNREFNLANDTLQRALKADPESREVRRALARVLMEKKDPEGAVSQLREAIEAHPGDPALRADLGDLFLAMKAFGPAEQQYAEIKRMAPASPLGYVRMSRWRKVQGDGAGAVEEMEQAYRLDPQAPVLLASLVKLYLEEDRHDQALSLCNERIEKDARDALAYSVLGQIRAARREYEKAEAAFRKAIEIRPDWPAPQKDLAKLYLVQGKRDEALAKYEAALEANPEDFSLYLVLGQLYEQTGDFPGAIRVYDRALEKTPGSWVVMNNLASILSDHSDSSEDLKRALSLAQEAVRLNPEEAALLDTLGWIHFKMGETERAFGLIERAVSQGSGNPVLHYHMGVVLDAAGRREEAREQLEKALDGEESFPGREQAEALLKRLS